MRYANFVRLIIVFAVFVSSLLANASGNACDSPKVSTDPTIKKLASDLNDVSAGDYPYTYKNCSETDRRRIVWAVDADFEMTGKWMTQLRERYSYLGKVKPLPTEEQGGGSPPEEQAYEILKCSRNTIQSHLTFECNVSMPQGNAAYTFPIIGKTIYLSAALLDRPQSDIDGLILHEITHKCGTTDTAYFQSEKTPPHSTPLVYWSNIADTYNYWVQYGFCIPGSDC